jgi:transcriptional regulator of acetoin/glycerol metabolism
MKALSVIELAKLYGMNRQSIYKRLSKGDLSKNSDGKIDLAEAIRVFGEPSQRVTGLQLQGTSKQTESYILEQQVDFLKKQLELAQEREAFQREQLQAKDDQIESLQRLLGAPKPENQRDTVAEPVLEPEIKKDLESTSKVVESDNGHQLEKGPKRRGLFGRVIRAVLE